MTAPHRIPRCFHLIIYHLTNWATGRLTILCSTLHCRFGSSDAPLFGCSVVRMDDVWMTAPHRTCPAQSNAQSFGNALIIGSSFIGTTEHTDIRPSVFATLCHEQQPPFGCPVVRLPGCSDGECSDDSPAPPKAMRNLLALR